MRRIESLTKTTLPVHFKNRTKMDIAREMVMKNPKFIKLYYPKRGEGRSTRKCLLFWAEEDKQLKQIFQDYPELFERMCKLTSPLVIEKCFQDIRNHGGMWRRQNWDKKGKFTSNSHGALKQRRYRARLAGEVEM